MLALVVLIVAALVAPFAARSSAAGDADRARPVVLAGDAVPGGGTFERFSVESLPIVAPVTSEGRVAFFATILRGRASEGFFVWSEGKVAKVVVDGDPSPAGGTFSGFGRHRSEEHTSELQSQSNLVCRLLLEKKKQRDQHDSRSIWMSSTLLSPSLPRRIPS